MDRQDERNRTRFMDAWNTAVAHLTNRRKRAVFKPDSRPQRLFVKVLPKVLGRTVEQAVQHVGGMTVGQALGIATAAGAPAAVVAAAAAGAFVEHMCDIIAEDYGEEKTSALRSATSNLRLVLSGPTRTAGEHQEDERLLDDAAKKLQAAKDRINELYFPITANEALVRALMVDSRKFMNAHLADLQEAAAASHERARALRAEAAGIQGIRPYTDIEKFGAGHVSRGAWKDEQRKIKLENQAEELDRYSRDLLAVIEVVNAVAATRGAMMYLDPAKLPSLGQERTFP